MESLPRGPARGDACEDPTGSSEMDRRGDDGVRDRFMDRFEDVVGEKICRDLRVGYYGHDGNIINLGSNNYMMICDYIQIAVGDEAEHDVQLLKVNGERVGKMVPWKTFVTFVCYLYTRDCGGRMMCETVLVDMLQGVLNRYRADGVVLEVDDFEDRGRVKKIQLRNAATKGPPFVELFDAYRVTTSDDGARWTDLCTSRQEAIARGFVADDCVEEEPRSAFGEGAPSAPDGHVVGALARLDRRLDDIIRREI
jgi:hypothetical protein